MGESTKPGTLKQVSVWAFQGKNDASANKDPLRICSTGAISIE